MKKYIGTKVIEAMAMTLGEFVKAKNRSPYSDGVFRSPKTPGYLVKYKDGYESWSPKDVFEEAYRSTESMSFGDAIEALKQGKKVARIGWNGNSMWLWLKTGTQVKAEWCHDESLKAIAENNGGSIEALGTICMKTADNKILSGWLASQTDMLAEDWEVVE